jgi:thiamine biosynthesis lipoprotein
MKRRQWLRMALGLGAAAALPARAATPAARLHWRERALQGFGSTLWLRAGHADAQRADAGLDAAVAALRHVERQMSLFDPASAAVRLNRDGVLDAPDPQLVAVLRLAQNVAARSGGAFDATVQPLWALWQRCARAGRVPTPAERRAAQALVGWRGLAVQPQRIAFARPGMAVTLNGIAQGFAADRARDAMRAHGIAHALLDTGEWAPLGDAPDGGRWQLGLEDPRAARRVLATLAADGRAVACSSDAHQRFSADGRHHHILDPRRGDSPPQLAAVAVLAPSAALADALTKPLFMGSAADALALARRWGVDVVTVDKAGRLRHSAGVALRG